jgi:predicted nucleic acid-binding protein
MDIKVLLDTNIIMDIFDANRKRHKNSLKLVRKFLSDDATLYVNSDTLTTSFYLLRGQKKVSFEESLYAIRETVNICELIPIEIDDVDKALLLCEDKKFPFKDYEDALQYACAKKIGADLIITNDKGFVSLDIEVIGSNW